MKKYAMALILVVVMVLGSIGMAYASQSTWSPVGGNTGPFSIHSLLSVSNSVYAGSSDGNVYKWNGAQWITLGDLASIDGGSCIISLITVSGAIYAGDGGHGVWSLTSGSWSQVGIGFPSGDGVYCLMTVNGAVYAGTHTNGVWSLNDGTWRQVGNNPFAPNSVDSLTTCNGTLYAGTTSGVWSMSGGIWSLAGTGFPSNDGASSLVADNGVVYAGTWINGIWSLSGASWSRVWTTSTVHCLVTGNNTLYAGTTSGVWSMSGSTWYQLGSGIPSDDTFYSLAIDSNGKLYAGTQDRGMWSWDGASWSQAFQEGSMSAGLDIGLFSDPNGTVYAATNQEFYSLNGGVYSLSNGCWSQLGMGLPNDSISSLAIVNGVIYVGTYGVYYLNRSTWSPLGNLTNVRALAVLNGTLYAGAPAGGGNMGDSIYMLQNGTWSQVGTELPWGTISCLSALNGNLYAGISNNGVYMLHNGAWSQLGTGIPSYDSVSCLATVNGAVYSGTEESGTYSLSGSTWSWMAGLSGNDAFVNSLVAYDGTLYVGTGERMWWDGGSVWSWSPGSTSWSKIGTPGSTMAVDSLSTDNKGMLYAGTFGGGVWSMPLPTLTTVTLSGSLPALTVGGSGPNLAQLLSSGQLTLSGKDQFGNSFDLSGLTVTWSVASESQYATISAGTSILSPIAAGSGTIVATVGDVISSTITFTVNPAATPGGGGGGGGASPSLQPVNSTTGSASVPPSAGGTIALESNSLAPIVTVKIPAGALQGSSNANVTITAAASPPSPSEGYTIVGAYDLQVNGGSYSFNSDVTLTFTFDQSKVPQGSTPAIYYYNGTTWVLLTGTVSGDTITVSVNHFTMFAVIATAKMLSTPTLLPSSASQPESFSDVPSSYWAYVAIGSMSSKKIVSGYPDGTFKPNDLVTRAGFATMLVKALGLNNTGTIGTFSDITPDSWYYASVNTAVYAGLVSGMGDGLFAPNAPIAREQMSVMIARALGNNAPAIDGTELNAFSDRSTVSRWAVNGMEEAIRAGIVSGMTASTLAPLDNATRAQAAAMIYKLLSSSEKSV